MDHGILNAITGQCWWWWCPGNCNCATEQVRAETRTLMMKVVIMMMKVVKMMMRVLIMMMVISRPSNCNCATSQVSGETRTHGPSSAQTKKKSTNQQADGPL